MSVSTTNDPANRWLRSTTRCPLQDGDDEAGANVVSETPFEGGTHLLLDTADGLVQLFLDDAGNEILPGHANAYGSALAAGAPLGAGELHGEMPAGLTGRPLPGDRDNTLLVYSDDQLRDRVVVKVYRHPTPGPHPEVEVLSTIPSTHVPTLLGHVSILINGEPHILATVQEHLSGTDGFEYSQSMAQAQMFSHRAAQRFGETLRLVHDSLAMAFPTRTVPASEIGQRFEQRLEDLVPRLPELEGHTDWIRDFYRSLDGEVLLQRIHGNLGPGHTLFDETDWKFLDFSGDPALPWEQRRDLAASVHDLVGPIGMLQSAGQGQPRWIRMCLAAVLEGYGIPDGSPLLAAYVTDSTLHRLAHQAGSGKEVADHDRPLKALPYLRRFAAEGRA